MTSRPIADYALLSDCHSAALVSRDGSVDWLCARRFDGPAYFGRLLDHSAGHWRLGAVGTAHVTRRYLDMTMALETTIETAGGVATVTDAMMLASDERGHDLGMRSPGVLLRSVHVSSGAVTLEMECRPRPEYGLITPLAALEGDGVLMRGGARVLVLSSTVTPSVANGAARAIFTLREGESANFALACTSSWKRAPRPLRGATIEHHLEQTIASWRSWSALHQRYEGPWRHLVHHSGRVLQALTFQPTGAIVAAPTTSLPEAIGGERNWDYRYTWVRDASLTMDALWVAACPDEAQRFFRWMTNTVAAQITEGEELQIMFGVGGEHDLTERQLTHLRGWRDSRPVRIGNEAWRQRQIDVYGELLSAARSLSTQLREIDPLTRQFLREAADTAARVWREKDQGIWEVRGEPRHFLYSKLMCWVALDAAIELAPVIDAGDRVDAWQMERAAIHQAILERGWNVAVGAFTQSFDSDDLDASSLVMAMVGFLPPQDERLRTTVSTVARRLTDSRGLVYRYRSHDGLPGDEGTFLLCTFWLAQAQAIVGDVDAARMTMERAVGYANDVGLLAEEVDPATGELLGNFPQAFSHIGLINAAWAISRAQGSTGAMEAPQEVL